MRIGDGRMVRVATKALPVIGNERMVCCSPLTGGALSDDAAEQLASVFKALGDPTRVKLVSLIAANESGEACICDLTDVVGVSQPTVSHHMKVVVDAGLVTRDQRGKWAYYRVVDDAPSPRRSIPRTEFDRHRRRLPRRDG